MEPSELEIADSLDAKQVLKGLTSRHIGERLAMEQKLKEMGPRAADLLLQLMYHESLSKNRKRRLFWILLSSGLSAAVVTAVAIFLSGHPELMGLLGMFGGLGGLSALMVPSHRYYLIINVLSQLDDIRAVGPLAEALSIPDLNARTAVARALMRLLPRLQPNDAGLLNSSERAALCKVLKFGNPDKELDFMLIVLQALDTLEDVSALPTLESLARNPVTADNERRFQEAATQSVLHLQAVRDHLNTAQTYLRASSAIETSPEQLLRATQGTTETPAQQLLRAGQSPNEE